MNNTKRENIILLTDSYKLGHWDMQTEGTEVVYSYFESRKGAKYDNTVFFGLQRILKEYLVGAVVTREDIEEAAELSAAHFGDPTVFNREGWEIILTEFGGKLPLRIKAVKEGTPVPVSNVLMTVQNLGGKRLAWLTNDLESLLTHVWFGSGVATLSREVKKICKHYLDLTSENVDSALMFMLHDFGFRGVSSVESAKAGGGGHLVNFWGTDTLVAMRDLRINYRANIKNLAFSVRATEHSIMTARGEAGECGLIGDLIKKYPKGILSVVVDSYNDIRCVGDYIGTIHREAILAREGVFVCRPDSGDPEETTLKLIGILGEKFGFTRNKKGYKVLNPKVRLLWGDGIDIDGIRGILGMLMVNGWSAENMVFGMGGGLLQKINRDTQRNAFKCCAQLRNGEWLDISKNPRDKSKASKKGRLALTKVNGQFATVPGPLLNGIDLLDLVFDSGDLIRDMEFDEIRTLAKL